MHDHPRIFIGASSLSFLFGISLFLNSCGFGGNSATYPSVTAHPPYTIASKQWLFDSTSSVSFEPSVTPSPDGGVTIFREVDDGKYFFEHLAASTFDLDWTLPLPPKAHEHWHPTMKYRDGKLYCAGPQYFAKGDSTAFREMTIDLSTHQILSDNILFRDDEDGVSFGHKMEKTQYISEASPDSSRFVLFSMDRINDDAKSAAHAIVIHCHIFDISGKTSDTALLRIPLPSFYEPSGIFVRPSLYLPDYGVQGIKIDNDANLYVCRRASNDTLEIIRFPAHNHGSPEMLRAAFPSSKYSPPDFMLSKTFWQIDPRTPRVDLVANHQEGRNGKMLDILIASLDFTTKQVRTIAYEPQKDSLVKWIDQDDLDECTISGIIHDEVSGSTIVTLRRSFIVHFVHGPTMSRMTGSLMESTTLATSCKGFVLFGFDAGGNPSFHQSFPSVAGHSSAYLFTKPAHSAMGIYYLDEDVPLPGIHYSELDLASGKLSAPALAFEQTGVTRNLAYTYWENPKTAVMFVSGIGWYGTKEVFGHPMIFRLNTP